MWLKKGKVENEIMLFSIIVEGGRQGSTNFILFILELLEYTRPKHLTTILGFNAYTCNYEIVNSSYYYFLFLFFSSSSQNNFYYLQRSTTVM